jgi:hypothetical protein
MQTKNAPHGSVGLQAAPRVPGFMQWSGEPAQTRPTSQIGPQPVDEKEFKQGSFSVAELMQ